MHKLLEFHQKRLVILVSVLVILTLIPFSFAQGVPVKTVPFDSVCMTPETAIKVVTGLESEVDLKARIPLYQSITEEMKIQRDLAIETAAAQEKKAESANKALEAANKALDAGKQLAEIDAENCKKKVEAATPSFWHQLGTHVGAMSVGAVIAAVLVLAL